MSKITTYLMILIVMDLMFIITGQLCAGTGTCSFTSAIFSMITQPSASMLSNWFHQFIGNISALLNGTASTGIIGSLIGTIATAGVAVGSLIFGLKNDSILFASTGAVLALLVGDFINIFSYFYASSPIVAVLIFSPITVIYIFTCLEWVRGFS